MTVASGPPADIALLVGERAGFLFLEVGDFADKCLTRGQPDKLWSYNIKGLQAWQRKWRRDVLKRVS